MKKTSDQLSVNSQGAAGPNLKAVEMLYQRAKAFEDGQVGGCQLSVSSDQSTDDPTPTQKIWQPVSDLDKAQQQAFREMVDAMSRFDVKAAAEARERIQAIEDEQKQAHAAARAYVLDKLVGKVQVQG